jgi:hypothetical protein
LTTTYRSHLESRLEIESLFPALRRSRWKLRSPMSNGYNCHAWGACNCSKRWEPTVDWHWPIPYQYTANYFEYYTVDRFKEAFATLGYKPCSSSDYELGFQKIAIYTQLYQGMPDFPSHTARQRIFGRGWVSKLGNLEDIVHLAPEDLKEGYGDTMHFMKRNYLHVLIRRSSLSCALHTVKFFLQRRLIFLIR